MDNTVELKMAFRCSQTRTKGSAHYTKCAHALNVCVCSDTIHASRRFGPTPEMVQFNNFRLPAG